MTGQWRDKLSQKICKKVRLQTVTLDRVSGELLAVVSAKDLVKLLGGRAVVKRKIKEIKQTKTK